MTPFDPQPAEVYTQPAQVQATLSYLSLLGAFSAERLAALRSVHDALVLPSASPSDAAMVEAAGEAITREVEVEREIGDYRQAINNWALNDQSFWALKLPRPAFPAAPSALGHGLPPLPHIQNPAYFAGMHDAVAAFVPPELRPGALTAIEQLQKTS